MFTSTREWRQTSKQKDWRLSHSGSFCQDAEGGRDSKGGGKTGFRVLSGRWGKVAQTGGKTKGERNSTTA